MVEASVCMFDRFVSGLLYLSKFMISVEGVLEKLVQRVVVEIKRAVRHVFILTLTLTVKYICIYIYISCFI